jgi:uncharacterized membrane protein
MSRQTAREQNARMASEAVMAESWSTRWYTPLVAIGAVLLVLLILALAIVEVLLANAPEVAQATARTTPRVNGPTTRQPSRPTRGADARHPTPGGQR